MLSTDSSGVVLDIAERTSDLWLRFTYGYGGILGNQNIYGNFNISNQYNGEVSLYSLDINELACEYQLAKEVKNSEKKRRWRIFLMLEILALALFLIGYIFFLNRGDLSIADVFNSFGSSFTVSIILNLVPWLVGLASAAFGAAILRNKTDVEEGNRQRLEMINGIVLSKGYSRSDWRKARRNTRRD